MKTSTMENCACCRYRRQFYELATMNKNVLPGAPLKEMEIFFLGRECYDKLSHHDRADVFQKVMMELRDRAKKEFLVGTQHLNNHDVIL